MSDEPKTGDSGTATQRGTSMAGVTGTSAWPRNVTGPQALDRVRTFLSDELYPILEKDEHFRTGQPQAVIGLFPQVLAYLNIAQTWCTGGGQMEANADGGGQAYPSPTRQQSSERSSH
jgi:hypothetical protein